MEAVELYKGEGNLSQPLWATRWAPEGNLD